VSGPQACSVRLVGAWPDTADGLVEVQKVLGTAAPSLWCPRGRIASAAGCFICFGPQPGGVGREPAWAAAALTRGRRLDAAALATGEAGGRYLPGFLALREGPLLEKAVRSLRARPEVLVVNATGRDHPRRAGLALHLGAVLDLPTVGVTERPLLATGDPPGQATGAIAPLRLDGELVAFWLRSRNGVRPIVVHASWRTSPEVAIEVVLQLVARVRTPEPLRFARHLARLARAAAKGGSG
jgi:deoxyribonuclease V